MKAELTVSINSLDVSCSEFLENIKNSKNCKQIVNAVQSNHKYINY